MSDLVRMTLDEVHSTTMEIFNVHGVCEAQARAVADTVTAAERDDCKSHGLFRVPGYIASVTSGNVHPDAAPVVTDHAPSVVHVDGAHGFSPLAIEAGRPMLMEKARSNGIAAQCIINAHHFAALWPEVEALGEEGLAGFAYTAAFAFVAPAGGTKPIFGTNPMSFAWPRSGRPPLVFDQASSASARGEIQLHLRDGHTLPEGWAIGPDGEPTTDPATALQGAQLAFGGYKGAAIALMIELLAGALVGEVFSYEATAENKNDGGPPRGGELIIAIDPARCVLGGDREAQLAHSEALFAKILEQPGTRLPSDRRYEARKRTPTEGIGIPKSLHDTLMSLRGSSSS